MRREKPTVDLCFYRDVNGDPCVNEVKWLLEPDKGYPFKVCDDHLPLGLRHAGLPARVNPFPGATKD